MRDHRNLGAYCDGGIFTISVWAPTHDKIFFHPINGKEMEMDKEGEYFSLELEGSKDSDQYMLNVDGNILADPLSRYQPRGVGGPSILVDTSRFKWSTDRWEQHKMDEQIIYEMHLGTFTMEGTYRGAENKLQYLKDLGVTAIEIMPLSQAYGTRNWGYDGVFPFSPSYSYGLPSDLAHFIDRCHSVGLSCFLDIVYNHLGPVGNVFPSFAPYFSNKYSTPWGQAINLDGPYSGGVREMLLANLSYWVEDYSFDGFRMDSTQNIYDSSPRHFLSEVTNLVHSLSSRLGRKILIIAESDKNDVSIIRPPEKCGLGFDGVWADDLHHSFHSYTTGEKAGYYSDYGNFSDISYTLEHGFLYDGKYSKYLKASRGTDFSGQNPSSLIVALQNHDQIGNRALGERISTLVSFEELKLGASVFILSPFTPMIFMGEEYGETSPFWFFMQTEDRKFAEIVNSGRRREFKDFGWPDKIRDPDSDSTFMESKLKWSEDAKSRCILALYKDLIQARMDYIQSSGRDNWKVLSEKNVIKISYPNTELTVIHNFAHEPVKVSGRVILNTSSPRFGGSNTNSGIISEPGSVLAIQS